MVYVKDFCAELHVLYRVEIYKMVYLIDQGNIKGSVCTKIIMMKASCGSR